MTSQRRPRLLRDTRDATADGGLRRSLKTALPESRAQANARDRSVAIEDAG